MISTRGKRRRFAAAAAGLAVAALLAACGGGPGGPGGSDTVSIGLLQPLSGALAGYGEESQAGFEYVVKKINSDGGIKSLNGAKIKIVVADDASEPGKAATEARRLMGQEQVSMVVGSLLTNEMAAVSPVADQYQVPVMSMFGGGTNSEYLYTMGYPYGDGYAATFVGFIKYLNEQMNAGLKQVALASSNYEAGQATDRELSRRIPEAGLTLAGSVPLDQGSGDFGPAVLKLKGMKPDVVTGLVTQKDGIQLHKARATANADMLFVGGTGGYSDPGVWENLGDAVAKKALTNNLFGMTGFNENANQEHMKAFLTEAKGANLGVPIGQNFMQGAQAARLVQRILEKAGSAKAADVYKAIPQIEIGPDDDDLYLARSKGLKFTKDRFFEDVEGLIIQWNEDGSQDVVWPEEFASRKPILPVKRS